jgi:hypothetical protein
LAVASPVAVGAAPPATAVLIALGNLVCKHTVRHNWKVQT